MVTLAAYIYTINPTLFNPLNQKEYLTYLKHFLNSRDPKEQEIVCTCFHFFFTRKESLFEYFANNLDQLKLWLAFAKTSDSELRKAFLVSLRSLLRLVGDNKAEQKDKCNEFIRRIFGNISNPANFPELGNENGAIEWLAKITDTPYEDIEKLGQKVMRRLIEWDWGMRALYANTNACKYILSRSLRGKDLSERKYRLVEKTLQSPFFLKSSSIIEPAIGE